MAQHPLLLVGRLAVGLSDENSSIDGTVGRSRTRLLATTSTKITWCKVRANESESKFVYIVFSLS